MCPAEARRGVGRAAGGGGAHVVLKSKYHELDILASSSTAFKGRVRGPLVYSLRKKRQSPLQAAFTYVKARLESSHPTSTAKLR